MHFLISCTLGSRKSNIPPGFKANAAFFIAVNPVKRARVPGRANDDVENMIGITPEPFTCLIIMVRSISTRFLSFYPKKKPRL